MKQVKLPPGKAIFQNLDKPGMMFVGKADATKKGWKKLPTVPKDRILMQTGTGMFVLKARK